MPQRIRIWCQDPTGQAIYCLQGIPYTQRTRMYTAGWTWAKGVGTKGAYITHSAVVAAKTADALGVLAE